MSRINRMNDVRSISIDEIEHDVAWCDLQVDGAFVVDQDKSLEMGYKCYISRSITIDIFLFAFAPLPVTEGRNYSLRAKARGRTYIGEFECQQHDEIGSSYGDKLQRCRFHRDGKMERVAA